MWVFLWLSSHTLETYWSCEYFLHFQVIHHHPALGHVGQFVGLLTNKRNFNNFKRFSVISRIICMTCLAWLNPMSSIEFIFWMNSYFPFPSHNLHWIQKWSIVGDKILKDGILSNWNWSHRIIHISKPAMQKGTGCFFFNGTPPKSSKYNKVNLG